MRIALRGFVGLSAVLVFILPVSGADPANKNAAITARLTATIDRELSADWSARQITPAADADDAEFLRRVSLDLIGRIPRVAEVRAFLADTTPDKRARLVEKLMTMPAFASHLASTTRTDWLPQSLTNQQYIYTGSQFEEWLRKRIAENQPINETVRTVLSAKVGPRLRGGIPADARTPDDFALVAFFQANEVKPENLAATVSRAFMGVKLECAQCHDHPFNASLTRDQFWEFAAFFGEFAALPPVSPSFVGALQPQFLVNRLTIPNTNRTLVAAFPNGASPKWTLDRTPRTELVDWLVSPSNPYFARNATNRLWAHFFGIGIVDPVDETSEANPPSHPRLLDALATALVESGYDQRAMIRAIVASKAYSRSSQLSHPSQADARRFARMPVRGLTANQIYDSFLAATGQRDLTPRSQPFVDPRSDVGRGVFRTQFADTGKTTETQTSILQALMLMNGKAVADQTSLERSEVLAAVVDAPFLDIPKQVETLFLAAMTRKPTPEEAERFTSYVERGGASGNKSQALADLFWVLLNSTEFLFNH